MRNIVTRFAPTRSIGAAAIIVAGGAVALAAGVPAASAATVSAPTLAASFTPSEIGVSESSGITYTITNPNSSGSLYNVAFSDTLPNFATIDDPSGLTFSGCGSPTIVANPGAVDAGATGITVKAGTPCTISVSVVGRSIGNGSDALGGLNYSTSATAAPQAAPSSSETTAVLDVLAAPTAAITTPKQNAKYTYGEKVKAKYSCSAPTDANGSTLSACLATDDLGNSVNPGRTLDTKTPGVHTLDVQALDSDGDSTDATVTYTVLPDNLVTIRSAKPGKKGSLKLRLKVPGPGTLKISETHGRTTIASKSEKVANAKSALGVSLVPSAAGVRLLSVDTKLKVVLTVTYSPKDGRSHKIVKALTLS